MFIYEHWREVLTIYPYDTLSMPLMRADIGMIISPRLPNVGSTKNGTCGFRKVWCFDKHFSAPINSDSRA